MDMKLILEFSEFSHMRLGSGDSVPQSTHVDNPSISMDGYSRYASNLKDSLNRLNQIYLNINRSNTAFNLRSGDVMEMSDIKNIKILRIVQKNDIYVNVYFSFEMNEKEYYGYISKINDQNPVIHSEIFSDIEIHGGLEWDIRVKGNLIKAIRRWMNPSVGNYMTLKEIDAYNVNSGELFLIPFDKEIEIIRSSGDNNILITYNGEYYNLRGRNYYYFNYYFTPSQN